MNGGHDQREITTKTASGIPIINAIKTYRINCMRRAFSFSASDGSISVQPTKPTHV